MKRRFGVVGVFAFVFVSLIVVGLLPSAVIAKDVELWSWREAHKDVWDEVNNQLDDGVDFSAYLNVDYDAVVITSYQSGMGPTILTGKGAQIITLGEAGALAPLENLLPELSEFPEAALSQVSSGGHIYGVPIVYQTLQVFYNKGIFRKYGLSEPTTWEEFLETAEILKQNGVIPITASGRDGWTLGLILAVLGASQLEEEWIVDLLAGEAKFTDQPFVDLLARVRDLQAYFQDGFMGYGYGDMGQMFLRQEAAMRIDGSFALPGILGNKPADMEVGMFLGPVLDEQQDRKAYLFLDGGLGLSAAEQNNQSALEVLRYATTAFFTKTWYDKLIEIPALPGVIEDKSNPLFTELLYYADNSVGNLFAVRSVFERGTPSISTLVNAGLQGLFTGDLTPEELAEEIQIGISSWYPAFK